MNTTPLKHAQQRVKKAAILGIVLTCLLSVVGLRAGSQTAAQQQSQAEAQREKQERARQAEAQRQQREQERQAGGQHQPPPGERQPSTSGTPNAAPRSNASENTSPPATVYKPHSSSTSGAVGDNGSSSTSYELPASGTTVYKPHSLSASSPADSSSNSSTTYEPSSGTIIYKPRSLAVADPMSNSAPSTTVNGTTVYAPGSTSANDHPRGASSNPGSKESGAQSGIPASIPSSERFAAQAYPNPSAGKSSSGGGGNCTGHTGTDPGICINGPTQAPGFVPGAGTSQNLSGSLGLVQPFVNGMSATMAAMSNADNSAGLSAGGGSCYWSSEWDGLNPELQARLSQSQTVDTVIGRYGGPAQFIAYAQSSGNLEREFASLQGQGLGSSTDFHRMAVGFVDVARCRLGLAATQQSVNATLNNKQIADCDAARKYVADPNGLQRDLDVAIAQRRAHEDGLTIQQNLKAELLNDSWWERSKGPVVAAQIEAVCNEVQDFVAIWNPEEAKLSQGKDMLMKGLELSASMITAAYHNRESVTAAVKAAKDAEAQQLGDFAKEEAADAIKMGPAYGTYKALEDSKKYVETLNDAAEARAVVQDQLSRLDQQISQAQAQVSIYAERQMVLEALRQDVIAACVQKQIDIPKQ